MLYRAPVREVKLGRVSRRYGRVVVVMRHYPRFLPKENVDEYCRSLAPELALFTEFKARERALGDHDRAFAEVNYPARFDLVPAGWVDLERLAHESRQRSVYLICQCELDQRCHADLLLLAARRRFGAETPALRFEYPEFEARLALET